jgi:hypothetical protein
LKKIRNSKEKMKQWRPMMGRVYRLYLDCIQSWFENIRFAHFREILT